MAELHVQIDQNNIEYEIFASDGDCSQPITYKANISTNTVGSFGTIDVTDYRCYIQGLSSYYENNKTKIIEGFNLSSVSDLSLELIIHISGNKIQLVDTKGDETSLFYTITEYDLKHDVNVYFNKEDKEPYDIPILFKYGERFFAPKDKNSYFTRWNEIEELKKYNQSNAIQLNAYINGVYNILTEVDISQTSDYGIPCKGTRIFESDDKKFSTKRFSVSKNENQGKNYKTFTHKHSAVDGVQHKPRIGNICSFKGCKFDNKHITVVKNDNIDEVVVLFHKDDSSCKYPKLVLLNKYSKTYGSTTYGYYNINKTPDNCKGYEFKNIPKGCWFNLIFGDDEQVDCTDVTELRQLIRETPNEPSLGRPGPDDCKCPVSTVEVQTADRGSDGSNGEVGEETQPIDHKKATDFSNNPARLSHKITLKSGENPPNAYQCIERDEKELLEYSRFIYTAKTLGRGCSQTGPWNLYADTFFRLGTKTKNCGSSRQSRNSRCEFYKFKVSDHIIESFYEKEFYSIDVFFHTKSHDALLIQFFNGTIQHIIRNSRDDDNGWKKLDKPLEYENYTKLLKLLKEIESNIDTFVLLIDKDTTYTTTAIQETIKKSNQILYVSPYQSSQISVNPVTLFKQNYKQCVHTINTASGSVSESSYPLRLFMSDGSEVELYDSSAKRREKLEYTSGPVQNAVDVYLVKSNTKFIPVLISYNSKVYQPKTDDKNPAKTNKWVHILNGSNIISSDKTQENNLMLRKKLCLLKKQVETSKHHSARETLGQSPGQLSQVQTDSTSQHGDLGPTQDLSGSLKHQGTHSRSEDRVQLPHVQPQPATIDGTPSQAAPSHSVSPHSPSLERSPEQGSTISVASEQVEKGGQASSVGKGETGQQRQHVGGTQGQRVDHQQDTQIKASGHSTGSPTEQETTGDERGKDGEAGAQAPTVPSGDKSDRPGNGSTSSGTEPNNSSAQSSGGGIEEKINQFFKTVKEYAENEPGIFYGSTGGSVAGVGVIGTAGAVIYKKCIVGSAVAAGKAAAKVAASAASGM